MSTQTLSVEKFYDLCWEQWDDFIKYNPGARHRRRLTLKTIEGLSPKTVLDVGCGNAELLTSLIRLFPKAQFTGVDVSPQKMEENAKKFSQFQFQTLNVEQQNLEKKFDLVICSEVIEHIQDQKSVFSNLSKMLNPGGHLLLTCPAGKIFPTEKHFGHLKHPTSNELSQYAQENNLTLVKKIQWGFPFYTLTKVATNLNSEWALKNFATGKYGVKQKITSLILYLANYFNFKNSNLGSQFVILFQKRR